MNLTPQERLNARILIVDDQPANVSLLEEMLQEAGYTRVSSTMEPEQVCAMHRKAPFDLILLDLQMPGMDGFQVMEGLKASTAEDDYLPVLVITAQPGHKLRALQAGAKDFVSKPFDMVEVKARISNLIEYSSTTYKYFNVNQARLRGVTLEGGTSWGATNWTASWDLQNPRNLDTGETLVRRPRYHGNLSVDSDVKGWNLGVVSRFVGHRPDLDGANKAVRTGGYVTWGVFASKALTPEWQLSARVDNVFNKRYEVARDYSTPGTIAQLTLRYQPR